MTKAYIVVGCYEMDDYEKVNIRFTQLFGSVTEICKFLKKKYNFPEKDSRKLIINSFGLNTKLWISMPAKELDDDYTCCSVRISQHKVDIESRIHSEAD